MTQNKSYQNNSKNEKSEYSEGYQKPKDQKGAEKENYKESDQGHASEEKTIKILEAIIRGDRVFG